MMKRFIKSSTLCLLLFILLIMSACSDAEDQTSQSSTSEGIDEKPAAAVEQMPKFHTVDLQGNEVDESIFAQADITVVNFWGTYCGPCIDEMPDLAEWNQNLPEGVQIIGIIVDVAGPGEREYQTAKKLVEKTGVNYTNIIAGNQFNHVLENMVGVPTTFFVDSEGKCLCNEMIGADVEGYKKTVESLR